MKKGIYILAIIEFLLSYVFLTEGGETLKTIQLPKPNLKGRVSVEEAIQERRSVRNFKPTPLTLETVGQLLWATQGITEPVSGFRAAPSAGALYPLEIYLVQADGVYRYVPKGHLLEVLAENDVREKLSEAALGQEFVALAPVSIVIAAEPSRTTWKYGPRGTQYVHMEAGYAAENLHLQAVALGLGSVSVGAFRDAEVSRVIGLPRNQVPLLIVPVGHPQ